MTLPITIKRSRKKNTFLIELPLDRFERFAEACGLYSQDFLDSLERAEEDVRQGRIKKIHSFAELRSPKKR